MTRMLHWCDWRKPCQICDDNMSAPTFNLWCWLFGHAWIMQGEPIIHVERNLVETDKDCGRCGLKVTNVTVTPDE